MKTQTLKPKHIVFRSGIKYLSILTVILSCWLASCKKTEATISPLPQEFVPKMTMEQTLSDEAQKNTIAFDALGFMTGNLGSQTFFPPGKVADYSGFQYLRDNDPTNLGHNTSFVTVIAYNILNILNSQQLQLFVSSANTQVGLINQYAYKRYPLCKAFRRLIDGDLPAGKTELDKEVVKNVSAALYRLDGEISYTRAQLFGQVIGSMSTTQRSQLDALKALNGIGNWNSNVTDPLKDLHLSHDVNIAVMTYASEMYAWYAGSVTGDIYFCPERHGTYFGSFYLKDWPAMGNPNYTINEQLTATAGQNFLAILNTDQKNAITGIVPLQKSALLDIVIQRQNVSNELRKFLNSTTPLKEMVLSLSETYGKDDGEIIYLYATYFSSVYKSMTAAQKVQLLTLAHDLGYIHPTGGFLYSDPIAMPTIENTDYFFK